MIRIPSAPGYCSRLFRLALRSVPAASVFSVFLAIILSFKAIVVDGENFSCFRYRSIAHALKPNGVRFFIQAGI
jgi:hypothetical protein